MEAQETAETFTAVNHSNAARGLDGHDQLVVEPLMVPLVMVVLHLLGDRAPQMYFAQWNQPIQALALDRKHKSFREGVQIRTPRWYCLHPILPQDSAEAQDASGTSACAANRASRDCSASTSAAVPPPFSAPARPCLPSSPKTHLSLGGFAVEKHER